MDGIPTDWMAFVQLFFCFGGLYSQPELRMAIHDTFSFMRTWLLIIPSAIMQSITVGFQLKKLKSSIYMVLQLIGREFHPVLVFYWSRRRKNFTLPKLLHFAWGFPFPQPSMFGHLSPRGFAELNQVWVKVWSTCSTRRCLSVGSMIYGHTRTLILE